MIRLLLVLLLGTAGAVPFFPAEQWPLHNEDWAGVESAGTQYKTEGSSRGLHGRFLHITDFHLDSFYTSGSSEGKACHRGHGHAGYFGAEGSDCDSPRSLVNETFKWVEENLRDTIDFIVWTGDSARHDNDERIPRTKEQVVELNKILVSNFVEVFGRKQDGRADSTNNLVIPIVPNIGNNDIMPHNIFTKGPNEWTKKFAKIWSGFIPEEQRHTFMEGGWFYTEVIPDKLAVFSLNTMYFFKSNHAVDGCESKSEPGYAHMEWLRVQLQFLRERNMKAILIGHVPPARSGGKRNWDETCWQKYALWLRQYRDVVVGSLYGHMNIDHFILQDSEDIKIAAFDSNHMQHPAGRVSNGQFKTQSKAKYLANLRKGWSKMPSPPCPNNVQSTFSSEKLEGETDKKKGDSKFLKKIGGPWAERYSVSMVSPSVVPNYFPSLRIIEYNITDLEGVTTWADAVARSSSATINPVAGERPSPVYTHTDGTTKKKGPKFAVPKPPSLTASPGPAYSNQPLTWLSYSQYYVNLTRVNENAQLLLVNEARKSGSKDRTADVKEPEREPAKFEFELEYNTRDDEVYRMKDLTVWSLFELATRIARTESDECLSSTGSSVPGSDLENAKEVSSNSPDDSNTEKKKKKQKEPKSKVWYTFLRRAYVGYYDEDDIKDHA